MLYYWTLSLPSSDADFLPSPLSPRRERDQVHGKWRHTTGERYASAVLCKTCMSPRATHSSSDVSVIKLSWSKDNWRQWAVLALGTASTLSLLLLVFPLFYFPVWTPFYQLSMKRPDLCKRLFVVDEACYICRQRDDVQNSGPGESLNVKTAVSWDEGERRMCETWWIKEQVVHRSCQLMKRSFSPETCVAV